MLARIPLLLTLVAAAGASGGCFAQIAASMQTTGDGYCDRDLDRARGSRKFCQKWEWAKVLHTKGLWAKAAAAAREAAAIKGDMTDVKAFIAETDKLAVEQPNQPLINTRARYCTRSVYVNDSVNGMYQHVRCANRRRQRASDRDINRARGTLRGYLNGLRAPALVGGLYIAMCAEQLRKPGNHNAIRTLGCYWYASRLDLAAVAAELHDAQPNDRKIVLDRIERDAAWLKSEADARYPAGTRDRQIFFDLRNDVLAEVVKERAAHRELYDAVSLFKERARRGEVARCAEPLRPLLRERLPARPADLATVLDSIGDTATLDVAEALAQCLYLTDRPMQAAAIAHALGKRIPTASYAERLYARQVKEVRMDADKRRRFPELDKTKVSSEKELRWRPEILRDKTENQWRSKLSGLRRRGGITRGVVAKVKRAGDHVLVSFKKSRVRRPNWKCVKTNRIASIDTSGNVTYAERCRKAGYYTEMVGPRPLKLALTEQPKRGDYIQVLSSYGKHLGVIYSQSRRGRLVRALAIDL